MGGEVSLWDAGGRPDTLPGGQADVKADQGGDSSAFPAFSRCIEDWPTAGNNHPIRPSLAVDAGNVLWRQKFGGSQSGRLYDGGPVLSGNRLAFQSGEWVYFVNKDGSGAQHVKYNGYAANPSPLVADVDGNVYYSTPDGLYCLKANGELRWSAATVASADLGEFASGVSAVLAPNGVVYFAARDETVRAYRTKDGEKLWSQPAPKGPIGYANLIGGGGKALFVVMGGTRVDVLATDSGQTIGTLRVTVEGSVTTLSAQWGLWSLGWNLDIAVGTGFVFDRCGNLRWSHWSRSTSENSGIIAAGELVVDCVKTLTGTSWRDNGLQLVDTGGNVVRSTTVYEGVPFAAGADGAIYTFQCDEAGNSTNRILAYSYDLQEIWRLDLGGENCRGMTGNVILDDDGVMYLTRPGGSGDTIEGIAIQTASPGLADSSWPSLRHDNRGTAWLVSGAGTSPNRDSGDSPNIVDAPEPMAGP